MPAIDIPILVKHMTVAIFKRSYVVGTKIEQIMGCFDIARHQLVKFGMLREGSEIGGPENIKLTAKGRRREVVHRTERGGKQKTVLFDKLYKLIQEVEENPADELQGPSQFEGTRSEKVRQAHLQVVGEAAKGAAIRNPRTASKTAHRRTARARRAKAAKARRR
jgi:hypothetical protein